MRDTTDLQRQLGNLMWYAIVYASCSCYSAESKLSKAHHRNKALLSSKEEKQKDQKEQLESDLFDL